MADKSEKAPAKDPVEVMSKLIDSVESLSAGHKQLVDGYSAMAAKIDSCMTKVDGCMSAIEAMKGTKAPDDADKDGMAAKRKELDEVLSAAKEAKETFINLQKEKAALGLKAGSPDAKAAGGGSAAPDAGDRKDTKAKTYLELVAEKKAENKDGKLSAGQIHSAVQSEHPEAYQLHLASKGAIKLAA